MNIHRLKTARKNAGLSQAQTAKAIGIAQRTYSEYERGLKEPSFSIVQRIATLFDVSIDWLLNASSNKNIKINVLNSRQDKDDVIKDIRRVIWNGSPLEATKKTLKVDFRISEDSWNMFLAICEQRGVTASSEIRRYIEEQLLVYRLHMHISSRD